MSKHLIDKIKQLEEKHNFISENLINAVWILDADTMRYDYISPSIKEMSGYSAEEYLNVPVSDRLTEESLQKVMTTFLEEKELFKKGVRRIRKLELQLIHKDGHKYWIEVGAKFIKKQDEPLKIIGTTREISEQKKNEQDKNNLIEKLQKALAEKERLQHENKILRGLLPICSGCRRIRDDEGKWWPLDAYIVEHSEAKITHTICDDCHEIYYDKAYKP